MGTSPSGNSPASAQDGTGHQAIQRRNYNQGVGGAPHGEDLAPINMGSPTSTHSSHRAGFPHPKEQIGGSSTLPQSTGRQSSSDPSQARGKLVLERQRESVAEASEIYWDCCVPGCGEVAMLVRIHSACPSWHHSRCERCPLYSLKLSEQE